MHKIRLKEPCSQTKTKHPCFFGFWLDPAWLYSIPPAIRNNQRGLPAAPDNVTRRITTALEFALQVAQGKFPPLSDSNLKKDCGQRIPYIVYSKRKPVAPDFDKDFPPMSVSGAASAKAPPNIPAAKSRVPAATMATPSVPPPPAYTSEEVIAPTVATPTVLPEAAAP